MRSFFQTEAQRSGFGLDKEEFSRPAQFSAHAGNGAVRGTSDARMTVPLRPESASGAFSSEQMTALRAGADSANFTAASTFGSMLPGAKCPASA